MKKKKTNKQKNKQTRRENDAIIIIIFIPEDPIRLKVLRGVNQRLIIFACQEKSRRPVHSFYM